MENQELFEELVQIADSEYGTLFFDEDLVKHPTILGYESLNHPKGIMYTPNVDKAVTVTEVNGLIDAGFSRGSQEFLWAYDGFIWCCPVIEFRPAKSLKNWPEEA